MWLIVLEALAALAILLLAVWWTMFSGRRRGERGDGDGQAGADTAPSRGTDDGSGAGKDSGEPSGRGR